MELKKGYKQTEVGVIPEEWTVTTVGQMIAEELIEKPLDGNHGNIHPKSTDFVDSGIPFVMANNVQEGRVDLVNCSFIRKQQADSLQKGFSRTGDVLLTHKATIGNTAIVGELPFPYIMLTPQVTYYRVNDKKRLSNVYLRYYFDGASFQSVLRALSGGGTRAYIGISAQHQLPVVFPPNPAEQRAIAEVLSDVDGLIGGLEELIAKKRDLKQAAMQQLLTGKKRLAGFRGDWDDLLVQDVIAGYFCGPSPTCEERNIQDDCEWGVLKTTAVTKENGWDWKKHKTLPRVFWNKPHLEIKKGDVIVTKAGPRHRVGVTAWVDYVPPRIIVSGKMIGLRLHHNKVIPLMLSAAISARDAQTYLDQRTTGMAESQVNFENTALLETPIRIPRIEEQIAIAEVLSDMDAELAALEQRRDKTRDLKLGMMQALLTGKTRLV